MRISRNLETRNRRFFFYGGGLILIDEILTREEVRSMLRIWCCRRLHVLGD